MTQKLKRRRFELQLAQVQTDILRAQIEIEEHETEIARKHEIIEALRTKVNELQPLTVESQEAAGNVGVTND